MAEQSQCPNCDVAHAVDDLFCENCGYDFITGSLPSIGSSDAPVPQEISIGETQVRKTMTVVIEVSPEFFAHAVSETELQIPDPPPETVELTFDVPEVHIGRTSESRGIHPDIDVAATTSDPAVSSRHAVLRVGSHGVISITDLGSTNGTVVSDPRGDLIEANVAVELDEDTWVYLGAWTRLKAFPSETPLVSEIAQPPA